MKINVLGINIDNLKKSQIIENIKASLNINNRPIFIVTPYSEFLVIAQKDEEFKKILNSADFSLPDGIGIQWAGKFLSIKSKVSGLKGFLINILRLKYSLLSIIFNPKYIRSPIPEKISGSEFIWDLAEFAAGNNKSIFLLGGFEDTPKIVAKKLVEKFPNLKIAGISNTSGIDVINKINSSGADFLFAALGPVRQEKWIYENLPKLHIKLAIGLGGTFDYIARKRAPAPQILRQIGLEWLWRLATQPWRFLRITKGVLGLIYYSFLYKCE